MDSAFTLTIDWLSFTVLAGNPQKTMKVLGGAWSRAKGGFRGYPLSWIKGDGMHGVGKLDTNALPVQTKSMSIYSVASFLLWRSIRFEFF